jgi:uncharacterized metal-binding protein
MKYTVLSPPVGTLCFAGAFIYGSFFLHPDVDLARNIRLFSLKGLLTLPFRPYSYLFAHRGISHMPLIGTLTRVVWLWLFLALMQVPLNLNWEYAGFGIAGLAAADMIHVMLDRIN